MVGITLRIFRRRPIRPRRGRRATAESRAPDGASAESARPSTRDEATRILAPHAPGGGRPGEPALTPPNDSVAPQLVASLARGVEASVACLPIPAGAIRRVGLDRVSMSTIGTADHGALTSALPADVIAGVLQRFGGAVAGTALLALDPSDALLWLSLAEDDGAPLERFVALGSRMIGAVVESLVAPSGGDVRLGGAALEERPLLAALLATHAPSDTAIVSLDAALAFEPDPAIGALHTPFTVQLLLDRKALHPLLASATA